MKLLSLSNRYYFVGLLLVSILGGITSFFVIRAIINKEFNDKLLAEKEQLIDELHNYDELLSTYRLNIGDNIQIIKVDKNPNISSFIKDTVLFDSYEKKELNFRQITFSEKVKNDHYIITISKSLLSSEDLIEGVTEIISLIAFLFFISMLILSNLISRSIWKPFYNTIFQMKDFDVRKPKSLSFKPTKIVEFQELNKTLEKMTNQVVKDYKNLKEYTENTSHEIQTPLAIIKNQIELLMQDEHLTERQLNSINKVYESAGRLSKLKDNLSILSKIDNNQFVETASIRLADYISQRIENVEELLNIKNIEVTLNFIQNPTKEINETLAYLLFNNLISNAIKHNTSPGELYLELTNDHFLIKNTGKPLEISSNEIFERFIKSGNKPDSTGLGLSMVHRITSYYDYTISYKNSDIWHTVIIHF